MNIDRPMVNLFFEIKRTLPSESRDTIKLSAPDIGERLLDIHQASSGDRYLQALIERFFVRAGEDWSERIAEFSKSEHCYQ